MTEAARVHQSSVDAFRTEAPHGFCEFLVEAGKIVIVEENGGQNGNSNKN